MTYLGAPAIAAALGMKPRTVRGWAEAQRQGRAIPLPLKRTASGRLWCTSEDVDRFFNPFESDGDRADAILARMKKHSPSEERRCRHAGHSLKAPENDDRNRDICAGNCEAAGRGGSPSLGASARQ
jgi:hypothetical protein